MESYYMNTLWVPYQVLVSPPLPQKNQTKRQFLLLYQFTSG